jgi:small-conductance mechanosensitive channel
MFRIAELFKEIDINIPFPQREIRIVSNPEQVGTL